MVTWGSPIKYDIYFYTDIYIYTPYNGHHLPYYMIWISQKNGLPGSHPAKRPCQKSRQRGQAYARPGAHRRRVLRFTQRVFFCIQLIMINHRH